MFTQTEENVFSDTLKGKDLRQNPMSRGHSQRNATAFSGENIQKAVAYNPLGSLQFREKPSFKGHLTTSSSLPFDQISRTKVSTWGLAVF